MDDRNEKLRALGGRVTTYWRCKWNTILNWLNGNKSEEIGKQHVFLCVWLNYIGGCVLSIVVAQNKFPREHWHGLLSMGAPAVSLLGTTEPNRPSVLKWANHNLETTQYYVRKEVVDELIRLFCCSCGTAGNEWEQQRFLFRNERGSHGNTLRFVPPEVEPKRRHFYICASPLNHDENNYVSVF